MGIFKSKIRAMGACCEADKSRTLDNEFRIGQGILKDGPNEYQLSESELQTQEETWARVEEIWDKFDEDKNGRLEKDEAYKFLSVMLKEQSGEDPTQKEIEKYFNLMYEDKSGDIDKTEAQKFLKGFELAQSLRD